MHCDSCSTHVKPMGQRRPAISREWREVRWCSALRLPMYVEHVPRCTCCTGAAKQNGSHPFLGIGWVRVAASSELLTISDNICKVITVKKQIRMCNYKIFYGNYFNIYTFSISTKSLHIGKSWYGNIFSMTIPAISADLNTVKKRYTEIPTELKWIVLALGENEN